MFGSSQSSTRDPEADAYGAYMAAGYATGEQGREGKRKKPARPNRLALGWQPAALAGKTILVIGENGPGDEILTMCCLRSLVGCCAGVVWQGDPRLQPLLAESFPGVGFVAADQPAPAHDGCVFAFELIGKFRPDFAAFAPPQPSFLRPNPRTRDVLRARYHNGSKRIIGLAWRSERKGMPLTSKSCDLALWAGLLGKLKDRAVFVSLQYGDTDVDLEQMRQNHGIEITQDPGVDVMTSLEDAAAQVAAMDYVVSISTTAAHLAGALGIPAWVLISHQPFPHWTAGSGRSPWYPSLTPLRQAQADDWTPLLTEAGNHISAAIDASTAAPSASTTN